MGPPQEGGAGLFLGGPVGVKVEAPVGAAGPANATINAALEDGTLRLLRCSPPHPGFFSQLHMVSSQDL